MELLPEWAPNIHPMLVHFPIAILSTAMLFDFIAFFLPAKQRWWSNKATAFLYGVGAATAIIIYITGRLAANSVFPSAQAQVVLNHHSNWALGTVIFYVIYAVARLLGTWQLPTKHGFKTHLGFFILSFFGLFLLVQTGNRGAKMVFKYGVGVQEEKTVKNASPEPSPTGFTIDEGGNWIWKIEKGAVQALKEQFHFLTGSIQGLNAEVVSTERNSSVLKFSGENMNAFFVTRETYGNVQMDYFIDISALNGKVFLVYNGQDKKSYYFTSVSSSGLIKQGRMINGTMKIFEKNTADVSKPRFIRIVSGHHLHTYVDKQAVIHVHAEEPKSGFVGLRIEGDGRILIQKITLTQLNMEDM